MTTLTSTDPGAESLVFELLSSLDGFEEKLTREPGYYPGAWNVGLVPTIDDLDSILAYSLLRHPFVRMYGQSGRVPISEFTSARTVYGTAHPGFFDYERAMEHFAKGFAIEFAAFHQWHRGSAIITHALARTARAEADAQVFISPGGTQALPLHRDPADGFAVHIHGKKLWRLYAKPDGDWNRGAVAEDLGSPLLEVVMEPGDVLYFPAGVAHQVISLEGEMSAHITFGMRHGNLEDLVDSVVGAAEVDGLADGQLAVDPEATALRSAELLTGGEQADPAGLLAATQQRLMDRNQLRGGLLAMGGRR